MTDCHGTETSPWNKLSSHLELGDKCAWQIPSLDHKGPRGGIFHRLGDNLLGQDETVQSSLPPRT